jgi:hypothetical protein
MAWKVCGCETVTTLASLPMRDSCKFDLWLQRMQLLTVNIAGKALREHRHPLIYNQCNCCTLLCDMSHVWWLQDHL